MKIVVLGAGAIGTILAAHLVRAGHEVSVIARGQRAAQIKRDGLRVNGLADFQVPCPVISAPDALSPADLLIVTVKTYDNKSALAALPGHRYDSVFSVANGVLKNTELSDHFGTKATLGCMANTSGELLGDGSVRFTRNVCLHLGALPGGEDERAGTIVETIQNCGINAKLEGNIVNVEWSKFVGWVALFALSVTTRLPTGRFLADPNCARLASLMIHEMAKLAAALGITIADLSPMPVASIAGASLEDGRDIVVELGKVWVENTPEHRLSALQDLERGKPLEVEETLGYALNAAHEHAVDMPTVTTCYELIAAINNELRRR